MTTDGTLPEPSPGPRNAPPPPPRPPLSDRTPAPIVVSRRTSSLVVVARIGWVVSWLVGVLVILSVVFRRTTQFDRLRDLIDKVSPGRSASTIDTAAAVVFWVTVGVLAAFLLLEVLLRRGSERTRGGRWRLLAVIVLHGAVALTAEAFVALGEDAPNFRSLLLTQLAFAAAALLLTALGTRSVRR